MKNTLFCARRQTAMYLSVFAAFFTLGCYTVPQAQVGAAVAGFQNEGDFGQALVHIPVRNFESLGLVFTEVELQSAAVPGALGEPPGFDVEGEVFTYQALLREAQELGADSIINITIDRVTRAADADTVITAWFGSALAIRFTEVLPPDTIIQRPRSQPPPAGGQAPGISVSNAGNFGELFYLPVKNFESLGLVFTQVELQVVEDRHEGEVFTWQALLKEAHELGADTIVNVAIDTIVRDTGTVWLGSALAVRFTDILPQGTPVLSHGADIAVAPAVPVIAEADAPPAARGRVWPWMLAGVAVILGILIIASN